MTFEEKLTELVKEYNLLLSEVEKGMAKKEIFQEKARELLEKSLKAEKIVFEEGFLRRELCNAQIIVQQLLRHFYNTLPHTKRGKYGWITEDGFLGLRISHGFDTKGCYIAERIELKFDPRLNFPPGGSTDRFTGLYQHQSEFGKLAIPYTDSLDCRGLFTALDQQKSLTVGETISRTGICHISLDTTLLGTGILTAFFKHMQYDGLDGQFP